MSDLKSKIYLTLLLCLSFSFVRAQDYVEKEKEPLKDRIKLGGGMSFWFGTETFVFLAPQISYKLAEDLYIGTGVSYTYYRSSIANYSFSFGGASLFSRYYILDQFFLHAELEGLRGKWDFARPGESFNIYNAYGGGGYSQSLGGSASVNMMILYNFNQGPYSPYSNPLIRFGFNVGL